MMLFSDSASFSSYGMCIRAGATLVRVDGVEVSAGKVGAEGDEERCGCKRSSVDSITEAHLLASTELAAVRVQVRSGFAYQEEGMKRGEGGKRSKMTNR